MAAPVAAYPELRCSGCDAIVRGDAEDPWRCPSARPGDARDHVLVPEPSTGLTRFLDALHTQPFSRYRELLWTYRLARARGIADLDWTVMVEGLDRAVARVDGRGFRVTPFGLQPALATALGLPGGSVWVKDETGNVAGSHKARHLFGLALALEVRERTGLADPSERAHRELAIASCGNAALAAAVVARAAGRPLRVFIPEDANPRVTERLRDLHAKIEVCVRRPGESGDPCVASFRRARDKGATPFCVQGNENGLTIEGGETLAFEMAEGFAYAGAAPDRLFLQTGGGALASSTVAGLRIAVEHGVIPALPRLHVVQTTGALPFRRAWERLAARVLHGSEDQARALPGSSTALGDAASAESDRAQAEALREPSRAGEVRAALAYARAHRDRFMWPWEHTPHSVAHGILDDETYDWAAVLEGTVASGGWPITVSESRLTAAPLTARTTTGIAADATGAAGLAGLEELARTGAIAPHERVVVVLSGVQR